MAAAALSIWDTVTAARLWSGQADDFVEGERWEGWRERNKPKNSSGSLRSQTMQNRISQIFFWLAALANFHQETIPALSLIEKFSCSLRSLPHRNFLWRSHCSLKLVACLLWPERKLKQNQRIKEEYSISITVFSFLPLSERLPAEKKGKKPR